jgi:hypothetical protein
MEKFLMCPADSFIAPKAESNKGSNEKKYY